MELYIAFEKLKKNKIIFLMKILKKYEKNI